MASSCDHPDETCGSSGAADPVRAHRRRRRWWIAVMAVLVLSPIVVIAIARIGLANKIEAEIAAIRARGEPMSVDEVAASLPPLTEEEHHAPALYSAAFAKFVRLSDEEFKSVPWMGQAETPEHHEPLAPETLRTLQQALTRNAAAFDALHRAIAAGPVADPRKPDWTAAYTVQLEQFINAAEWLVLKAMMAAEAGDPAGVAAPLREAWLLADRQRGARSLLIDHLVSIAIRALAVGKLKRGLSRASFDDAQLVLLLDTFSDQTLDADYHRSLLAERTVAWSYFQEELKSGSPFGEVAPRAIAVGYRLVGFYDLDRLAFLEYMERLIAAARQPPSARGLGVELLAFDASGLRSLYTRISQSVAYMERVIVLHTRVVADIRLARAALAVERFRLAEGRRPEFLDEIAPQFIEVVPLDPFTGAPLFYKQLDKGYTIYSVGEDGTDHHGAETNERGEQYERGSDIPFTVAR